MPDDRTFSVRRGTEEDLDALMALRAAVAGEGVWIGAELPLDEEGDRRRLRPGRPGTATFVDRAERHGGRASLRMEDLGRTNAPSGNGRVYKRLAVQPFRHFHLHFKRIERA